MASIDCPNCKARLEDYTIEVIASGGKVVGRGGIICPRCGVSISNQDIERFLSRGIASAESSARQEAKPEGAFIVGALLFLFGAVFMIYTLITSPFGWLRLGFGLLVTLFFGYIGVVAMGLWIEWLKSQISPK